MLKRASICTRNIERSYTSLLIIACLTLAACGGEETTSPDATPDELEDTNQADNSNQAENNAMVSENNTDADNTMAGENNNADANNTDANNSTIGVNNMDSGNNSTVTPDPDPDETERDNPDWTDASHSKSADPDYDVVFAEGSVRTITLTLAPEMWAQMQEDVAGIVGGGGGGGGGGGNFSDEEPMWGEGTVTTDGVTWTHVGIRYKGNSTLSGAHREGRNKYPFKLDFDEWEDDYPAIDNQRFYGFKQLNLSSNYGDSSYMREKVAADLYREFGVASARTAFVEVMLDKGDGPERLGIYTLVEEVDDTLPEAQFDDDDGNLYKPDGDAASFAAGTYDTDEFELKTNKDEPDYSDVLALYEAIHADTRTTDVEAYKAGLEAVFDVEQYLKYLAVNMTIQNWDTYGLMTHNYYLYNDGGRLTWIPWDNNEAFDEGKRGGALELDLAAVGSGWPLLRYVMDIPEYEQTYQDHLIAFTDGVFAPERMADLYDAHAATLSTAVSGAELSSMSAEVSELKAHAASRSAAVDAYVGE